MRRALAPTLATMLLLAFSSVTTAAGPYDIGVQLQPRPPVAGVLTMVTLQVTHAGTPSSNLTVVVKPEMPDMPDMPTQAVQAAPQASPGQYQARVPLAMEGNWNLRVGIVGPLGRQEQDFTVSVVAPGTTGWATHSGSGSWIVGGFGALIIAAIVAALMAKRRPIKSVKTGKTR